MKRSTRDTLPIQSPSSPLSVFCAAAPADGVFLAQWETYLLPLQRARLISCWSTQHISAGADIEQQRLFHLHHADLIFLLLSADFFASKECLAVMQDALEQQKVGPIYVIPLLLRPVEWQETELEGLTCLPANGVPVVQWAIQDEAWHACVLGLQSVLRHRLSASAFTSVQRKQRAASDRERMLRRLRQAYKNLLDESLYGMAWMDLKLVSKPNAVRNASHFLVRLPKYDEQVLPPHTSILHTYEQAQEELLILGAPGAGKSTLLLDLALQLVERASIDETHPLPVILPLSSWAVRQPPLTEWLVEQFAHIYDVPKKLSTLWVEQEHILPLLDGLDEMEEAVRPACIAAINTYHREHLVPLVVCSRENEYEEAAARERLTLQSAVVVQPLTSERVEIFLRTTGAAFSDVRAALHHQPALQELATTPLMLNVLLLTYQGAPPETIVQLEAGLEQRVWTDYISQMVQRKGNQANYPLERTCLWLTWLAQQMRVHQQTIFYAEYLHTDWLTSDQQQTMIWLSTRLPALIIGACLSFLVSLFVGDPLLLPQIGLLGGFIGVCLSQQVIPDTIQAGSHHSQRTREHLRNAVLLGVVLAACSNVFLGPPSSLKTDWLRDSIILGAGSGLSFWVFQRILYRKTSMRSSPRKSRLRVWLSEMAPPHLRRAAISLGVGMGLSYGLIFGLIGMQRGGLKFGLGEGLSFGLIQGLSVSVMTVLIHIIFADSLGVLRFAEHVSWTWHGLFRPKHIHFSFIVAGIMYFFYGMILLIAGTLARGLAYGLPRGLLNGLAYGLVVGVGYWVLFGLYQGIKQEHLADQDRQQFNQGMRRSLRNGLLAGLFGAIIITATGIVLLGLSYGLVDGLSAVLNVAWILFLAGMAVIWTLSGGLTVLRHYIIRWLLARSHRFPWQAQAFLDDATARILLQRVGGGYRFMHRRLLNYFANLDSAMVPTSIAADTTMVESQVLSVVNQPKRNRALRKVRLTQFSI